MSPQATGLRAIRVVPALGAAGPLMPSSLPAYHSTLKTRA